MTDAQGLISVRHVTKSFVGAGDTKIPVLEGIDLEVKDGEFVALLGRSGSGKSTLLRCMAGLIAPSSGEVFFRGERLLGCNPGTAMVFQTFALLPWLTVQQNVEIGLEARGVPARQRTAQALHAIDVVGLDGYESAFPKELSGGMRQRVGFARALVLEPDVLLMDEPFSALDVLTAENLRGELLELWEGHRFPTRSVVMVTHNIEEAVLLADRILVLGTNPGRLRAELVNNVPRPRHRRTPDFDELVDQIYEIMTGTPKPVAAATSGVPDTNRTPGDTPLPHATVDGLSGLAEILEHREGVCDLADLARLLGLEVDDMLPLIDALVLLGLATLEADTLKLTERGRVFAGANIQESKQIFAAEALERAPLVRTINRALRGSKDGNLPSGFFTDLLHRSFGEAEARGQLDTAINWGRYAELYGYDGGRDQLILEEHESHNASTGALVTEPSRAGALHVYLGAYPGSGKTFAMLRDAHRRRAAGEDVVVAAVDARSRPHTEEAIGDLERVAPIVLDDQDHREEMDLDGIFRRHPQVALVDDLAHLNAAGCRNAWRWQDVDALLEAGIDVMTTLDASQLEGQRSSVERITGMPVTLAVPDSFLDRAADVQFIDIAPSALQRRISHGNVCPRDEIETALDGPFRLEALGPLRELALRLVARRVGGVGIPARLGPQDVVVAVEPGVQAESLVRRGARLARRTGGRCTVVTVRRARREPGTDARVTSLQAVAAELGAVHLERRGTSVEREICEVVREVVAQDLVIGASGSQRGLRAHRVTLADRLIEALPDVNVHVIARLLPATSNTATVLGPADEARFGRRGTLRVYLGYARGCGATTAMLDEARRRRSRGTDCVVAAVDHLNPGLDAMLGDIEIVGGEPGVPPRLADLDAVRARNPQVVCVDDLAVLAQPGGARRAELDRLLDAGITVIATLQVGDDVDESVLELVDDIELVDLPSAVLRERVRAGQIVEATEVESSLRDEFSEENLARRREAAFRLVAWHADNQQVQQLRRQGAEAQWEARPRVMACVAPRPGMERLIRRAAGLAASLDTDFRAVTVLSGASDAAGAEVLERYSALTVGLGGQVVVLHAAAVAPALAQYARDNLVTEVLAVRGPQGGRHAGATRRELIHTLSDVDIHLLSLE
jgi:NitT/TauT family transport system ATP-binding protein